MSSSALREPSFLSLKVFVSKGIGSPSWILADLASDGTDGRGQVLLSTDVIPLSKDPSDPSDPSAGESVASVVAAAVAAGLRCPSDATVASSSERNFINLS